MFLGYSTYPAEMGIAGGSVKKAELDEVTVAGSLTKELQRSLATRFRFAVDAYHTLHCEEFLTSLLIDPASATRPVAIKDSDSRFKDHILKLVKWKVMGIAQVGFVPSVAMSTYFEILKSNGMARTIFGGRELSSFFRRPPPVCLPSLPLVLALLSELMRGRKFFFLAADQRHFFHQIQIGDVTRFFSLCCCGVVYVMLVLAMGFSYSPRIAQCYAWAGLLACADDENGLKSASEEMRTSEHPPAFVYLESSNKTRLGLCFIWYDNFLFFCTCQKMSSALSRTLDRMQREWRMIWGEKKLWHPQHLSQDAADIDISRGVALGIQFATSTKRGRNDEPHHLVWRLKPKTAAKAVEMLQKLEEKTLSWTCKEVAGVIGSCIWHTYITGRPFTTIHDALELSSRVGKHAQRHRWGSSFSFADSDRNVLREALTALKENRWIGSTASHDWESIIVVASDATLKRGAWVRLLGSNVRGEWKNWPWLEQEGQDIALEEDELISSCSIFLLELRAAIQGIMANGKRDCVLLIIIDNTAAAATLRNMYSPTLVGRDLISTLYQYLTTMNIRLIVVGIPGLLNDADAPTRGLRASPAWSATRLEASWKTAADALRGVEKSRLNTSPCGGSHWDLESLGADEDVEGEAACAELSESIQKLMSDTTLCL